MEKYFDTIDIVFIVIISIYMVALFLFVSIYIIKYYDLDRNSKNKPDTKFEIFMKKCFKAIIKKNKKIFHIIKEFFVNLYYKITKKERKKKKRVATKTGTSKKKSKKTASKSKSNKKKNNNSKNNNKQIKKTYKNNISYVKNNPKKNSK